MRILFCKVSIVEIYRFIFKSEKSLHSQLEWRTAVFTCGSITNQQQLKCLSDSIRVVHCFYSNGLIPNFVGFLAAPPNFCSENGGH